MSHHMADHVQPKILLSLGQLCQTSVHIDMDKTVERRCTSYPECLVHCIITCILRLRWIWEGTSWPAKPFRRIVIFQVSKLD